MMGRVVAAALCIVSLALPAQAENADVAPHREWSYSGDEGPEHWADLDPEYRLCREGKAQSPIVSLPSDEDRAAGVEVHPDRVAVVDNAQRRLHG